MALKCEACSLCRQPNIGTVRINGTGNSTSPIMVVLGRSTREDDRAGRAFQGTANQFFRNILKSAAINPDNCYFTNTVKCVQFGEDKEVAKESFKVCPDTWLKKEIDLIKPKVILALGNDAYEALTGNKSVIKDRGSLHVYSGEGYSSYVLPTYSPYYMAQAPNNSHLVSQCVTDLRKVNSIITGKFGFWSDDLLDNGTLNYSIIDSLTKLQEVVQKAYKSGVLACDIEARKADAYRVESTCVGPGYPLVSLQFATNEAEAFFLPWANIDFQTEDNPEGFAFSEEDRKLFIETLRPLLEDPDNKVTLIGHNFKFDAKWINKYLGIKCKLDYDTMLASSFLGEASNKLKKLAWSYTSIGGYESAQDEYTKGLPGPDQWDMFKYPLSVIIPYGCADADATLRIYNRFVADGVVNKRNAFVFESIITASNAFTDIEHEGIHVDREYLSQLDTDLELEMRKAEEEFRMMAHAEIEELNAEIYKESLGKKGLPLKHKNTGFIISSNDHISRLFYDKMGMPINDKHRSKKTKEASTGVKAMQALVPNYPIVSKLLEWRKVSKQKSGFVDAYPKFLDDMNRIHPDFKLVKYEDSDSGDLTGAITGRLSCSDPNLQNVPARGEGVRIKRLFIPDFKDDHLLVDFDFAGVELRVAAMYCQDPKMINYFNSDQADFHAYAASQIYGCSVENVTKAQRTLAKTFNFCVPMNTEALTPTGFKSYYDLSEGDMVFGLDPSDGLVKPTRIKAKIKLDSAPMVRLSNNHFSVVTTPDHRWYGSRRCSSTKDGVDYKFHSSGFFTTKDITTEHTITLSGKFVSPERNPNLSDDECELIGWVLGDGSVKIAPLTGKTSQKKGSKRQTGIWVHQSKNKPHHFGRLTDLLSKFPFKAYPRPSGIVSFRAIGDFGRNLWTRASLYNEDYTSFVLSLSARQRKSFLDGFFMAEGTYDKRGAKLVSQNGGSLLEAVKLAIFMEGYFPTCSENVTSHSYKKEENRANKNYVVRFSKPYVTGQRLIKTELANAEAWCIETELGTWIMRQDGVICNTGNCILYGGSAAKVAELTGVCVEEAEKFIEDYFKVFPGLSKWIKDQHRFVKQNGYVTSMFGRVRHLADAMIVPKTREENNRYEAALRRAVNSPVQGDASDLTLLSLGRIWKYLSSFQHTDPAKPSRLRGSVHDSILLSVHVEDAGEIIPHIKFNILENPGVDFITSKGVSLRADVSAGPSWGDQTDLVF